MCIKLPSLYFKLPILVIFLPQTLHIRQVSQSCITSICMSITSICMMMTHFACHQTPDWSLLSGTSVFMTGSSNLKKTTNVPQPKVFSSILQGYQENPHSSQMPINDKGNDSLSNPPAPCKTKIIICLKCGGN